MSFRTISVLLDREDLPEMWEAALETIEQKRPEYKSCDVEFWELPPHGHYGYFEEPADATCVVTGYDEKYVKLPTLKVTVESADIASEDGDGSCQGYLVTVDGKWLNKDTGISDNYALVPQYSHNRNRLSGFEFVDLKRVESPKLEAERDDRTR